MFLTNHWTPPIPSPPMIMLALRKSKLSQTRNIANISIFSLRRTRLVMIKSHTGVKIVYLAIVLQNNIHFSRSTSDHRKNVFYFLMQVTVTFNRNTQNSNYIMFQIL